MSDIRLSSPISPAPQCHCRGLVVAGRVCGSEPAEVGKTPVVGNRSDASRRGVGFKQTLMCPTEPNLTQPMPETGGW